MKLTVAELIKKLIDMPMGAYVVVSEGGCMEDDSDEYFVESIVNLRAYVNGTDAEVVLIEHDWSKL